MVARLFGSGGRRQDSGRFGIHELCEMEGSGLRGVHLGDGVEVDNSLPVGDSIAKAELQNEPRILREEDLSINESKLRNQP